MEINRVSILSLTGEQAAQQHRVNPRLSWLGALILNLLLIPKPALIGGPRAQIPDLDDAISRSVDIVFGVDLLDADLQAVLGKDDVLLLQLVARGGRDLLYG